jgi:hypothetical protein
VSDASPALPGVTGRGGWKAGTRFSVSTCWGWARFRKLRLSSMNPMDSRKWSPSISTSRYSSIPTSRLSLTYTTFSWLLARKSET